MMTIRRSSEARMETVDRPTKGCWIEVTHPSPEEARQLARDLSIPLEFVTSALDPDEIPLVESADGALLISVRIAHFQSASAAIPYVTLPMNLIVTDERVVTVCQQEHELLQHLPHEHQADLCTAQPTRFALHLLWSIANNYIRHLNEITKAIESLEDRLQRSLQNQEVLELLRYQKSLLHFTTALRANEPMLERLRGGDFLKLERSDKDLLDDVFTENRQAIAMSEITSNILSQMMDAFASIISNNLNIVMKFLASVTVILIVPTILSTLYGMNVPLPLADHPLAFVLLAGVSVLSAVIVGLIFWKKGWL